MSNTLIVIGMLILVSVLSAVVAVIIVAAVESKWVLTIRGEEEEESNEAD